ncbi:hypothetical protein [Pseudanabaena sp. FACHB-2040]|uniref:hypothetical protein n=1 Tax=Pseudanabaena sp. FACHB-2040 TaxID=2692859 RepID=UPI0016836DE6|nr:hypothetical protein [Pseudanabaena sp. FACHB-2040]MBD2257647.1 hypothetical protein [Pseudanabaena sp. FACHB-2040]
MPVSSLYARLTDYLVSKGRKPGYVIGLDSATVALKGIAQYLHGKELRSGGVAPELMATLAEVGNRLPNKWVETVSTFSGWLDASGPWVADSVRAETVSRWVVNLYPKRHYPGAMIGSSNGAAVHLCAALGMPWLPQTLLTCLRHSVDKDDPEQELAWATDPAQRLLKNNPDLKVYQMHDPNQDRLKVGHVTYFRLKRTRLGEQYKQFLKDTLEPGATLFLLECEYQWLATQADERHSFQFGGKGKLTPIDYFQPTPELAEFLHQRGSKHRRWQPPLASGWIPESEWGFDAELREDVEAFARENGFRVRRICFNDPQDLSPLVADLYRWWYQQRGLPSNRLFVESFVYLQPWWALRLGLVPYWKVFNDRTSLELLNRYLDSSPPYDDIYLTLFSNGLEALGGASIEEWRTVLKQATRQGHFLGVDERKYPRDGASFVRHYTELKKLPDRFPMPTPLTLQQLDQFLAEVPQNSGVQWATPTLV